MDERACYRKNIQHNTSVLYSLIEDDENDLSMLKVADKKIVVNTAPSHLKTIADVICLPPKELGIIHALKEVL